jgi:hypothetical protein
MIELPRATSIFNMHFFKPAELGLIPLLYSLRILTLIQDLPSDLWPERHGLCVVSQAGFLLLVTCILLASHYCDPQLPTNTWRLSPTPLWPETLPILPCPHNQNLQHVLTLLLLTNLTPTLPSLSGTAPHHLRHIIIPFLYSTFSQNRYFTFGSLVSSLNLELDFHFKMFPTSPTLMSSKHL